MCVIITKNSEAVRKGKSGEKPARSRHCEAESVPIMSLSHWFGKARTGVDAKSGDLLAAI